LPIKPGYLDFHVHVGERIGGYTLRDDFADLQRLCHNPDDPINPPLMGMGVFVTQPDTGSLAQHLEEMQSHAARNFSSPVYWHLTPTRDDVSQVVPLLGKGIDLKFYTTYRAQGLYRSYTELERWMQDLSDQKTRFLIHCEDDDAVQHYSEKHPFRHPFDHTLRRPERCELIAVEKVLDLALKHQHPVHIVHVSSPNSALLIQEAKKQFSGISCETTPHYLLLNEDDLKAKDAHRLICTPPFRSERSRGMLVELLQDGVFDILASDHCAFTLPDKDRYKNQPEKVPCGIAGIGTLFSSVYEALVRSGKITLQQLVELTQTRVMQLMELEA